MTRLLVWLFDLFGCCWKCNAVGTNYEEHQPHRCPEKR